jgi:hypothetical protein
VTNGPFTKKEQVDEPGIIGARWWQESIAVPRRQAMHAVLVVGGISAAMVLLGTCATTCAIGGVALSGSGSSPPDHNIEPRSSLDMQKEYGWDFGAAGEALVFDGKSTKPFDRSALGRMETDLAPAQARLSPWFVPTLFQSVTAVPKSAPAADPRTIPFVALKDALHPIFTFEMEEMFRQGKALAALVEKERPQQLAVIVDLSGPAAVAFAAGAAGALDPVFLFDNWPHPRGVVLAHRTLAAAAYYQPLFAEARAAAAAKAKPPMFVLDRTRLASYTDDTTQFDNRHIARMPGAISLATLGVKNAIYVAQGGLESDDLVDDFLAYRGKGISLRHAQDVTIAQTKALADFPLLSPLERKTDYSRGVASPEGTRPRPSTFGTVPVAVAVGTGVILGAKLSRSGSWNRTSGTSSGS